MPPQAWAAPGNPLGRRDQEETCPLSAMALRWLRDPRGTSHFPDIRREQVTVLSCWSPWAPESLPEESEPSIRAQQRCWGSRSCLWLQAVPFPPPGYSSGDKVCPSKAASASGRGKRRGALSELHVTGGVEGCFVI